MGSLILSNAKLWLAGYDLSGQSNALALEYSAEEKDETAFGMGTRKNKGGLKVIGASAEGFWEAGVGLLDEGIFTRIGVSDEVVSMAAEADGAEGQIGYTFKSLLATYEPLFTEVGEIAPFSFRASGRDVLARGTIVHNATRTASGNGTAFELGEVAVGKKLYAALHVLSAVGTSPTLDVIVQSDDAQGFGSPTSRITFGQKTAIGAEWATPVAGAIADTWWRVNYTIGGTLPSLRFVVILAIQ